MTVSLLQLVHCLATDTEFRAQLRADPQTVVTSLGLNLSADEWTRLMNVVCLFERLPPLDTDRRGEQLTSGLLETTAQEEAPAMIEQALHVAAQPDTDRPKPLSVRERQVLQLAARGYTNGRIAAELDLAPGTVKNHLYNINAKLDVGTRLEAVLRAQELGLLN
jgi:ATP/maltotriose-dependent transcriptional regulator MalT